MEAQGLFGDLEIETAREVVARCKSNVWSIMVEMMMEIRLGGVEYPSEGKKNLHAEG